MSSPAPRIDRRPPEELVATTERLLQRYTGWQATTNGNELGRVLVRVFARLASLVVDRLNQVPEKGFLAFLDLLGLELLPPRPARVPLTFTLAAGSPVDALVPAGTRVATSPAEGETTPVVFETERDLVVVRSQLVAALTREPGRDRYADNSKIATGQSAGTFAVFQAEKPIDHVLYLGHALFGVDLPKEVTLQVTPASADHPWLSAVEWSWWNGETWVLVQPSGAAMLTNGTWGLTLPGLPGVQVRKIGERQGAWLRGRLTTPLPHGNLSIDGQSGQQTLVRSGLSPDAAFADGHLLDTSETFGPFGDRGNAVSFYLACTDALSKPGATVTIDVALARPAPRAAAATLIWEYWNGAAWAALGHSDSTSATIPSPPHDFADGTQAFTRDGTVTFRAPSDWEAGTGPEGPNVTSDYWLRARVFRNVYGPPGPAVDRLALGYAWPLPRVDSIGTSVRIVRTGLAPDLGFTNQLPVDLSKDFWPFGEKPRLYDTLYLASDEAFSRPRATITLHVALNDPPGLTSGQVRLRWEAWDAEAGTWTSLGESGPGQPDSASGSLQDQTKGFTSRPDANAVPITFTLPARVGPVAVNGQVRHWIRVRIVAGDYGTEAHYVAATDNGQPVYYTDTKVQVYELRPATFQAPSIQSIRIDYDYRDPPAAPELASLASVLTENDFAIEDHTADATSSGAGWFTPYTPTVDRQPTLYLGFERTDADNGFANRATQLYFGVAEALYDAPTPSGRGRTDPAVVAWDYWNGHGWARLGTRDETQGFATRGLVTFVGPPDFRRCVQFGREAFWLRARWESGTYARVPQLRRVLTNTTWATQSLTVLDEVLGSGTGDANQVFRTTRAPVLPGQIVEVRESELPSPTEQETIRAEEGENAITAITDASGRPTEIWVRWHQVPDFFDSGPRSRHYVLDRLTGQVSFGNAQRGMMPPVSRNGVRVTRYATGGGVLGNRPIGAVTQLMTTVPYVQGATNLEPAAGDSPLEDVESIKVRGPKTLRHRDRAVIGVDFEDLALQASTDVARVKVIVAQDRQAAGSVGLIVVPRDVVPRPVPSIELLAQVQAYLEARLSPTVDLSVRGPDWIQVTVTAEVVPRSLDAATDVQSAISSRLAAFLHPLTGGPDGNGWAFGRRPYRSDLYSLIESTPGVDHVRLLQVEEKGDDAGQPDSFLIFSGDHQLSMVGGTDGLPATRTAIRS